MRSLSYCLQILAVGVLLLTQAASGVTINWTNPSGGLWSVPGNWSQGVPQAGDSVDITLSGTYTVTLDVVAAPRQLVLGGASGTQTLLANQNINLNYDSSSHVIINPQGVLDLQDSLFLNQSMEEGLTNSGIIHVRSNRSIITTGGDIASGGVINLYSHASIRRTNSSLSRFLTNTGTLWILGDSTTIFLESVFNSGTCLVDSNALVSTHAFFNDSLLSLAYGGKMYLQFVDSLEQNLTNNIGGTIQLRGGSVLNGRDGSDPDTYPPLLESFGLINIIADTMLPNRQATILLPTTVYSPSGLLQVSAGNLLGDVVNVFDSLRVAAPCSLLTHRLNVVGGGTFAGAGTVRFLPAASGDLDGSISFTGGFWLTDSTGIGSTVTLIPQPLPTVHLRSLNMSGPLTTFNVTSQPDVVIDSILHYAGTVRGTVVPGNTYVWNWGRLGAGTDTALVIPPGANLTVSGGLNKRLDSLALWIEGTAAMQDTGLFILEDSAVVDVKPSGTLYVGPALTMTGVGQFYNRGQSTFDPQGDTITFNIPVTNTTLAAREAGTIDIPSAPVILRGGGKNEGTINVLDGGGLILEGEFMNEGGVSRMPGTLSVASGGSLTVTDSLSNHGNGTMQLVGGSAVSGDGVVNNGGNINKTGPTNILFQPYLTNLADSGFLNVQADTLTLSSGGLNKGTITIQPGAVLKVLGTFINDTTGVIGGGGVLDVSSASFVNNGSISPGSSPGQITINGNVTLGAPTILNMEMAGPALNQYDRVTVSGSLALAGRLRLSLLNAYSPSMTDTFRLCYYASRTGQLNSVEGTPVGDGRFMEIAYRPTSLINFVCNGISRLSYVPGAFPDTIDQAVSSLDTFAFAICDTGHCPLQYSLSLTNLSPPTPAWITVEASEDSGLITRTQCSLGHLYINVTGLVGGNYSAQLNIVSNDPNLPLMMVPLALYVIPEADTWDIGGGSNDFATFAAAVAYLNYDPITRPQVFNVWPGTYNETVTLSPNAGTSPANTITFRAANPANRPLLTSAAPRVLRFAGADYVTWDGINILRPAISSGVGIVDTLSADFNAVRNCDIIGGMPSSGITTLGIFMRSASGPTTTCDNNLFENLTVTTFTTGIALGSITGVVTSPADNTVRNCVLTNCPNGITVGCQRRTRIYGNTVTPAQHASQLNLRGIQVGQLNPSDTVFVYNNRINDATGSTVYGIDLRTAVNSSQVWVYNNQILNSSTGTIRAIVADSSTRATISYNSIYFRENASGSSTFTGIRVLGSGTVAGVFNNIVQSDAVTDSTFGIYYSSPASLTCNYNCLYGPASVFYVGRSGGTLYHTLPSWRSATGWDLNSISMLPGFADSTDLHIDGYYSDCDSAGTPVPGISSDMDGQTRNGSFPDIGADEFNGIYYSINNLVIKRQSLTNNMQLNWSAIPNAVSYKVYGSSSLSFPIGSSTYLGSSGTTSWVHTGIVGLPDVKRFYVVRPSTLP